VIVFFVALFYYQAETLSSSASQRLGLTSTNCSCVHYCTGPVSGSKRVIREQECIDVLRRQAIVENKTKEPILSSKLNRRVVAKSRTV